MCRQSRAESPGSNPASRLQQKSHQVQQVAGNLPHRNIPCRLLIVKKQLRAHLLNCFLTGIVMTSGAPPVQAIAQSAVTLNARLTSRGNEFHGLITCCMIKIRRQQLTQRGNGQKKKSTATCFRRKGRGEREGTGFALLSWD